jgi:opacity protein-like surface antigen
MKKTFLLISLIFLASSLTLSQESKYLFSLSGGVSFPHRQYSSGGVITIYVPGAMRTTTTKILLPKTSAIPNATPNKSLKVNSNGVPFYNNYNTGFNIGIGGEYRFAKHFSVVGLFDYNYFPFNERDEFFGIKIKGDPAKIITISGDFKYSTASDPKNLSFFLTGGFGYMRQSVSYYNLQVYDISFSGIVGKSQSAFMLSLGIGVDIPVSENLLILTEVKYVIGFTKADNTYFIPLKIGIGYNL